MGHNYLPKAEGLYDPRFEKDACGVGFVANIKGVKSHEIIQKGIELLINLEHRGAVGAEKNSGDGAGILIQMPDKFFRKIAMLQNINLPSFGNYAVGVVFIPRDPEGGLECQTIVENCILELGLDFLGWRKVPTDNSSLGDSVKSTEPHIYHIFVAKPNHIIDSDAFERKLYVARKYIQTEVTSSDIKSNEYFYIPSLSYKTILYKGQLITAQLPLFFADLNDKDFESAIALVHSRFSTNTFPSWPLAQPFRYLAHNGEINTLRGNINWMRARQSLIESNLFSQDDLDKIYPYLINEKTGSDSSILDNVVELLTLAGRTLPHVMTMMIPEAWEKDKQNNKEIRDFYEYHATLMEPWDGPASLAFTDGKFVGATLDRNGLRPSRYILTKDDILVMASEQGAIYFPPEDVLLKGRLQPGKMFLVNLDEGRIVPDIEIKTMLAKGHPYGEWLDELKISLDNLPLNNQVKQPNHKTILRRQKCYGYTIEDLKTIIAPMAKDGYEAIGSMGNDATLPVLSNKAVNLFNYFHQLFAQVTNPPIDPIREESVMSLVSFIGQQGNLFEQNKKTKKFIELPQPILTNENLEKLRGINESNFKAITIDLLFDVKTIGSMEQRLVAVRNAALTAVQNGFQVIILSTRGVDKKHAAIPSLLAISAVHHHLVEHGMRTNCGIVIECGDAREVHHFATLIGYGANAINPYLAFETIEDLRKRTLIDEHLSSENATKNYINAIEKGLLKIMSKMGISTIQSYTGAQIFEAVGLSDEVVAKYFKGTASRLSGIGINEIEAEVLICHEVAFSEDNVESTDLSVGGLYSYRQRGEKHQYTPENIFLLQQSARTNDYEVFKQYSKTLDYQADNLLNLRGLLDFKKQAPISIDEVESVEEIRKRFATGAMSYGSISLEAHQTMAIAMNAIGAKSNTGEGGEDPLRFKPFANGDNANSSIKQVASGRFGVTMNYLVNAKEIQIKMAQGAKPGEGGQLPGDKVDDIIGKTRYSTPGVGLISPPPHHDIYSIEDLKQLIHDLKNANKEARISVKLVSEVGVGTIAAGVAKAHSDVILISGYDGGTGASPQTSIKHTGLPWELGLAEAHQTLVKNGLRSRIVLQTDGQLKTGRDIVIATLLGAEEWGVATSALIVEGCIMMRKCHLNTCPVGIATQDPELRAKYKGKPEHIINYITFLAMEIRELMAELGFRTINEMVGRVDKLEARKNITHPKAKHLKLERLLHGVHIRSTDSNYCSSSQEHGIENAMDNQLIEMAKESILNGTKTYNDIIITNVNRTLGTLLSSEVTRKYGENGLPNNTIHFKMKGSAGQSFGAFLTSGITFEVEGEVNDYVGKGLCGGRIIVYPSKNSSFEPKNNVIIGNVAFYGATSGEAYIYGLAGERFAVRNSGANIVTETLGDHGCEYMTGGNVVVLGEIGKNFAAGMSGGIAYIYDVNNNQSLKINSAMVYLESINSESENTKLKTMIENHFEFTSSKTAKTILENWETAKTQFIKVIPKEYKKVLQKNEQKCAQANIKVQG